MSDAGEGAAEADAGPTVRQVIPKDAIPGVDDPRFVADYGGDPADEVIVLDVDGDVRAYPVRYLNYHEIVNDVAGAGVDEDGVPNPEGTPVAATWCPLCGSAVVYDRRIAAGDLPEGADVAGTGEDEAATGSDEPAAGGDDVAAAAEAAGAPEFGVSGKLADDDLVMYDRATGSEWKQSLGEAIAGPLAGASLRVLPATMTTAERFAAEYPDGLVLAPPGGHSEAAGEGDDPEPVDYDDAPYRDYFERDGFGLDAHRGGSGGRDWDRDDIEPKDVVLGLEPGEEALGFPLAVVERKGGVVATAVGGEDVLVVAADGIHAYRDPGRDWELTRGGLRGDGALYEPATGDPIDEPATHVGADPDPLERLPARRLFAFAWLDDHGPDAFYGL